VPKAEAVEAKRPRPVLPGAPVCPPFCLAPLGVGSVLLPFEARLPAWSPPELISQKPTVFNYPTTVAME